MALIRLRTRGVISILGLVVLAQPFVAAASVPNDPYYAEQWYMDVVHAPAAWDTVTGSEDVVVAILDTGVDVSHPDLANNIWVNPYEVPGNNVDDDANGFVDDIHGWDFVDDDNSPEPEPGGSVAVAHGTLISGIVGAVGNNETGTAGMAWQVSIMPVRMLDAAGSGGSAIAADAVDYAVANGADVINMSFAGVTADTVLRRSIEAAYDAGVVVVAAMGNDSEDTDQTAVYPACLMDDMNDWVIGVAALDDTNNPSIFSNFGRRCTDLSAPGEDVYGPIYEETQNGYASAYQGGWSGTSVASPMVTGAVALVLSAYPDLTVDQVRNSLKLSVDPLRLSKAQRGKYGAGLLNVAQALAIAAQFSNNSGVDPTHGSKSSVSYVPRAPATIAVANAAGKPPIVEVYSPAGILQSSFMAYAESYVGGMTVAMGDVDGDGVAEIVTGTSSGGGPHVRVFRADGTLVGQFFAYDAASRKGVDVALGDVDGDGDDEIITAVGSGVSQDIVVFDASGEEYTRFPATAFTVNEALHVAYGDVDGDKSGEFIVTSGAGSAPKVAVYSHSGAYISQFAPYAASFMGGVYVAVGDVDGNGTAEIITGTGNGGGPQVRIFRADGSVLGQFFAYDSTARQGVRVALVDANRDGVQEIVTVSGLNAGEARTFTVFGVMSAFWPIATGGNAGSAVAAW